MHKCSCSPAGATVNGVSAGVRQQTLQSEGYGKYESPPKLSLFMAVIAVGIAVVVFPIKPVFFFVLLFDLLYDSVVTSGLIN
uniref:Uncharacterized protein n=1 Tax=Glossina austeni TaxID=7395 RepID=A0A1A9VPU5_GLOAU